MTSPYRPPFAAAVLVTALLLAVPVQAGPGAHGPNGEHLDGPAGSAHAPTTAAPRLETRSEAFELVATLAGGELSLLIDRYETNEPVLGATVEVESGGHKAQARFHADHGDYAVVDEAFLKAVSAPGEHALIITVTAGEQADLLDGVLKVMPEAAAADDHGHDHAATSRLIWMAGGLAVLTAFAGGSWLLRRRALRNGRNA